MKEIRITLVLAMVMMVFVGCRKTETDVNNEQNDNNISSTDETTDVDQGAAESTEQEGVTGSDEEDQTANDVQDTTNLEGQDVLSGELSVIIDKIYEKKDSGLMLASTPLDLTNMDSVIYNTGMDDISKVKEAIISEAMISSQAYSLVLVRVNDPADAEEVANDMKNGINQSKWICVTADDLQIVTHDDLVLLIMVSSELKDTVTSQQIIDAFQVVCGEELDLIITK